MLKGLPDAKKLQVPLPFFIIKSIPSSEMRWTPTVLRLGGWRKQKNERKLYENLGLFRVRVAKKASAHLLPGLDRPERQQWKMSNEFLDVGIHFHRTNYVGRNPF